LAGRIDRPSLTVRMNEEMEDDTIARIEALFEARQANDSNRTMEQLLQIGREIGSDFGEHLIDRFPRLMALAPAAARHYYDYISQHELAEANALLAHGPEGRFHYGAFAQPFGKHNYDRVRDMFDTVDFRKCHRFVLIGCGPLPMTLYHVHDRTAVPHLIAVDVDAQAVELVTRTVLAFRLKRISTHTGAGESYDFSDADVIYVANLVRPKKTVLDRIAETAPRGAVVVLRDPFSLGRLLTDRGMDHVGGRIEVMGHGPSELSHFSRHVFLRVTS
jgi:hypothetical protein